MVAALPAPATDGVSLLAFIKLVEPLALRADADGEAAAFIRACSARVAPAMAPLAAPAAATIADGASAPGALARGYCQWLRHQLQVVLLVQLAPAAALSENQLVRPTGADVKRYGDYVGQLLQCADVPGAVVAHIIATVWPLVAVESPLLSLAMSLNLRLLARLRHDLAGASASSGASSGASHGASHGAGAPQWRPRLEEAALSIKALLSAAVVSS